jgi:hypothetical protein
MWNVVIEQFLPVFFMIITPPLTVFVGLLFRKLAKKWNLETAMQYDSKVDELVIKGIQAAEQKSIAAVRKGGEKTPNEKKLEEALKFVNSQLTSLKLPQKASDQLSYLIEAHLFAGAKDRSLPAPAPAPAPTDTPAQPSA